MKLKRLILFLFFIFNLFLYSFAETLKAGVSEEYIPNGFYGSWGVVSKLIDTNNSKLFNYESKDIWILSGYSNILSLQNLESGAVSQIVIKQKSTKNNLKFNREKVVQMANNKKVIYKESVEFFLNGDKFSGCDNFIVEEWNNNNITKKNTAKYKVSGIKISGQNPD